MNYVLKSGKLSAICKNKQADKKRYYPGREHTSQKRRGGKKKGICHHLSHLQVLIMDNEGDCHKTKHSSGFCRVRCGEREPCSLTQYQIVVMLSEVKILPALTGLQVTGRCCRP